MHYSRELFYPLLMPIILLVGLVMLFAPGFYRKKTAETRERALKDRERRGSDAYFEEQRTLEAYGPRSEWTYRLLGLILVILSGSYLVSLIES